MPRKAARILVTGGAGYLGSVLVRRLLDEDFAVTVLDNFAFNQASLLDCCGEDGFEVLRGDARDERLLKEGLKSADVVIPLAALVGAPLCEREPEDAETTNLGAIRSLCRLASPSQPILYPTTNSGYGIGEKDAPCTEDSPLRPISRYGRTKVEAERAVLERGRSLTFRLATVFGASPRMRTDLLVNDFVLRAARDRALIVFEGRFRRNFIHIQDVARAFLHGLANFERMQGKPYNVGLDSANLSKLELCARIQKVLPGFVYMEAPVGEDPDKRDYLVSNARLAATGFKPEWDLERGIRELVKCYRILGSGPYANV